MKIKPELLPKLSLAVIAMIGIIRILAAPVERIALVASKPSGRILELGTGTGLATSWIIDGMDAQARLITIENSELLLDIARSALRDARVEFILADGYEWIRDYSGEKFDLIFVR